MTGLFKGKAGKAQATQNLLTDINQFERDVVNYDILKNYLVVYIYNIAIPYWKYTKARNYLKAMKFFCTEELNNANRHQDMWNEFAEIVKTIKYHG